jgi:hypothetical protein
MHHGSGAVNNGKVVSEGEMIKEGDLVFLGGCRAVGEINVMLVMVRGIGEILADCGTNSESFLDDGAARNGDSGLPFSLLPRCLCDVGRIGCHGDRRSVGFGRCNGGGSVGGFDRDRSHVNFLKKERKSNTGKDELKHGMTRWINYEFRRED